jgi:hypothetical protein
MLERAKTKVNKENTRSLVYHKYARKSKGDVYPPSHYLWNFFYRKKGNTIFLFKFPLIAALMNSEKKNSVRFGLSLIDEWIWKYNLSLGLDLRSHVRQIPCVYKESFNA